MGGMGGGGYSAVDEEAARKIFESLFGGGLGGMFGGVGGGGAGGAGGPRVRFSQFQTGTKRPRTEGEGCLAGWLRPAAQLHGSGCRSGGGARARRAGAQRLVGCPS